MSNIPPSRSSTTSASSQLSSQSPSSSSSKSWITRSLGALMQLPKATPLAALRWTTPEGPMPKILQLPSRDTGRTVEVYVWVPPNVASSTSDNSSSSSSRTSSTPLAITPSFTSSSRPCVVDFCGGGFIMGGPIEEAPWCAALARSGIVAISVAYRLGPTWEFPAALHDAEDAVRAALGENKEASKMLQDCIDEEVGGSGLLSIDTSKVALSGFSSGGNIVLNMLLDLPLSILKESDATATEDWPSPYPLNYTTPLPALLFFPSLDARQATYERSRPTKMAPASSMSKFIGRNLRNAYLPADKVEHYRASPGLAPTSTIHKSTRALLILPEIDTLAEHSETWVKKLNQAGLVEEAKDETGATIGEPLQSSKCMIRVHRIKDMSHGFTTFPDTMLDVETRKVKAVVMEQARRWMILMLGGNPGDQSESQQRVEAIAEGEIRGQGVSRPAARLAKAVE